MIYVFSSQEIFNMGSLGTALALLLSEILLSFQYYFSSSRIISIKIRTIMIKTIILLLLNSLLFYLLINYIHTMNIINFITGNIFIIISNFLFIMFIKILDNEDKQTIKNIITNRSIAKYVKDELKE